MATMKMSFKFYERLLICKLNMTFFCKFISNIMDHLIILRLNNAVRQLNFDVFYRRFNCVYAKMDKIIFSNLKNLEDVLCLNLISKLKLPRLEFVYFKHLFVESKLPSYENELRFLLKLKTPTYFIYIFIN